MQRQLAMMVCWFDIKALSILRQELGSSVAEEGRHDKRVWCVVESVREYPGRRLEVVLMSDKAWIRIEASGRNSYAIIERSVHRKDLQKEMRKEVSRKSSACRDKAEGGRRGRIGREVEMFERGGYRFRDAPIADPALLKDRRVGCMYYAGPRSALR